MTGNDLRAKRVASHIPLDVFCFKAETSMSRLSNIERGFVTVSSKEIRKLDKILDSLAIAREESTKRALELGWPKHAEVRLRCACNAVGEQAF